MPTLTVVMPAYNEEGAIAAAVDEIRTEILESHAGSDLVVVDDGSRDSTGAILDGLAAGDPRIRVIHQPNGGHGAALRRALDAATGERILMVDSDRQIPMSAFAAVEAAGADGRPVFGVRRHREDPAVRLALSALIRVVLRLVFRAPLRDSNCPFKLVPREVWAEARGPIGEGALAPSMMLAMWVARSGRPFAEVEVDHRPRLTGVVSIRRFRLVRFALRGFRQLLEFRGRLP